MRFFGLAAALTTLAAVACSSGGGDGASSSEAAISGDNAGTQPHAACSLTYWDWVLHALKPALARPITEVSDEQMTALVAAHPPTVGTGNEYGVCWTPLFNETFFVDALSRLHHARGEFVNQHSPSYLDYPTYVANAAMTPELRRNAKALLALRPATMTASDVAIWSTGYSAAIAETIEPVALPSIMQYERIAEPEWVITADEAEYLQVFERARAEPAADGAYGEQLRDFDRWVFGPPPAVSRSFVFNLVWEPGALLDSYGLSGVRLVNGQPVLPDVVKAFVSRIGGALPRALGSNDSAAWMGLYNARAIRALGDLSQNQDFLTATDKLALDILEQVKPSQLRGSFAYETWLDLALLAQTPADRQWSTRVLGVEPCLDAPELAAATKTYNDKMATSTAARGAAAPPHACAQQ